MAGKSRDYAEEYRRRKARAQAAGFKSEREYKSQRRKARNWSRNYSAQNISKFSDRFTAEQTRDYLAAFVTNTGINRKDWHTIVYLHAQDPDTYPDADDVDFWSSYFEK